MAGRAFILRIKPSGTFRVKEALGTGKIIIGWSHAEGLLNPALEYRGFRSIVRQAYHEGDTDEVNAGRAATHLWRFIRKMSTGDLVIVPHGKDTYLAEILPGLPTYGPELRDDDMAYRRDVRWLNDGNPYPRTSLSEGLIGEINKLRTTSKEIPDYYDELLGLAGGSVSGEDWTEVDLDAITSDYREMLLKDLQRLPLNKSAHRRALMQIIHRSKGAVEFKHQNISAVLDQTGLPWIAGYKPMPNFQDALVAAVERNIAKDPRISGGEGQSIVPPDPTPVIDFSTVLTDPPPPLESEEPREESVKRLARKIDQAARDGRNRDLGKAGEIFVVNWEKWRLADYPHLAEKVERVSETQGDGLGYDVLSFNEHGSELYIEVKTTKGGDRSPFFISPNELDTARERGPNYRLYRVYGFGTKPKIFILNAPLEDVLNLKPSAYRAVTK